MENSSITGLKPKNPQNPQKTTTKYPTKTTTRQSKETKRSHQTLTQIQPKQPTTYKKPFKNGTHHRFIIDRTKRVLKDLWIFSEKQWNFSEKQWIFSEKQYFMFYILVKSTA